MTKRIASLTSTLLLALGIAAFAGSALAGNGNGSGSGNSENAPGQVKKDTASTEAQGGGSADQNADASVSGVKPTSSTAKGNKPTSCTTGGGTGSSATCTSTGSNAATAQTAAHADASKRYGNGTTAAQIANGRGAPAGTLVYGPGNSQPHKVACPGSDKFIDVHAMKSFARCEAAVGPTAKAQPTPTSNVVTPKVTPAGVPSPAAVSVSVSGSVKGASAARGAPAPAAPLGGVLGVTTSESQSAGGVLGAIEAVGEGALPFTGFPLWTVMLAALALITFGLALRRHARATV